MKIFCFCMTLHVHYKFYLTSLSFPLIFSSSLLFFIQLQFFSSCTRILSMKICEYNAARTFFHFLAMLSFIPILMRVFFWVAYMSLYMITSRRKDYQTVPRLSELKLNLMDNCPMVCVIVWILGTIHVFFS